MLSFPQKKAQVFLCRAMFLVSSLCHYKQWLQVLMIGMVRLRGMKALPNMLASGMKTLPKMLARGMKTLPKMLARGMKTLPKVLALQLLRT